MRKKGAKIPTVLLKAGPSWVVFLLIGLVAEVSASELSPETIRQMKKSTWRPSCPVPVEDLRLVKVSYADFDGQSRNGELIVHKSVEGEIKEIFDEIHAEKFPLRSVQPIETYDGSDDASMTADNTSAFNCRPVTGTGKGVGKRRFSMHAYGLAIDINPVENPYVKGKTVLPPQSQSYVNRRQMRKGMIDEKSVVYRAFKKRGWIWGAEWRRVKDYQHFEKPLDAVAESPDKN